ncbi:MAG: hypothetical protein MUD11_02280, partial [Rhodobacteraceae bacterium]|nr:hypothetical protein [Paracoccaceae bacterium]
GKAQPKDQRDGSNDADCRLTEQGIARRYSLRLREVWVHRDPDLPVLRRAMQAAGDCGHPIR